MRLDKYLTDCGVGSRKEVKDILKKGEIRVNSKIVVSPKLKLEKTDLVEHNGKVLEYKEYRYYLLNKVAGYITATEDKKDKTVMELLPDWVIQKNLFPVGRLDKDTEGLLLFTNDGELSHQLLSPKKHVEKVYHVEIEKELSQEDIKNLEEGVLVGGKLTKKSKVEVISKNLIYLTITEGRFHQVKKMLHAVKNEVTYLKRIKFGKLSLGDLKLGEVIEVQKNQVE